MRMGTRTVAVCAVVSLHAGMVAAQGRSMTLEEVLARAREQAPQIVSARLAVEEARGRLLGASVRLQSNPQIDAAVGNRHGTDSRFTDFQLGLGQSFEPGARRSARIDGANAAIAQSSANVDEVTRAVLRLAASSYYRAVHATERIKLLNATHELALNVYATADNLNMQGAWLHVLTDALGSLQAIVAGALIWKFGWYWVDPVASVLIGLLVIYSSWSLIRQSVTVLMEGPRGHIDVDKVRTALLELPHVSNVHDLHVWTITSGFVALSAHVTSG